MRHLLTLALVLCPLAAAAQPAPRSMEDCERIKSDLAYNQCLASFGPKVGERSGRSYAPAAAADAEEGERESVRETRRSRRGGSTVRRGRGGRQAATFDVISGRREGRRSRRR